MKVVNLCVDDWANFQYDNCEAMRSVGIDAYSYKLNKHHAKYRIESEVCSVETMGKYCKDADLVQIVHNNAVLFQRIFPYIKNKKINVIYTGTDYRINYERLNATFNPYVNKSIIALGEFAGLGSVNEVYLVGAIDTEYFEPKIETAKHPYVIAHYPSNRQVKGTTKIIDMMAKVFWSENNNNRLASFTWNDYFVNSYQQLCRMMDCDIYIELFSPVNNGMKYGSWGITALEAAALGKVVVTQNLSNEVYRKYYGDCALRLANSEHEFYQHIFDLIYSHPNKLTEYKMNTLKWVTFKHSYKATGEYIVKNIL